MIRDTVVYEMFAYNYTTHTFDFYPPKEKEDVFISVFGPGQYRELKMLKELDTVNILYVAPEAANVNYGKSARNTLVVWEFKQNETV